MSRSRRELDYLYDIKDAVDRVIAYTIGLSWEEYIKDHKTQDAVVWNLEVINDFSKENS